jgi:Zn-finger nucleic acid-binding protein/ribosomal protein S27AE
MSNDGDPFSGDPYRTARYRDTPDSEALFRQCPRCDSVLAEYGRVFVCRRGCGVWLSADLVRDTVTFEELGASERVTAAPARCAQCSLTMAVRRHGQVVFDFCAGHGVWLDRGERLDFKEVFSADDLEEQAWLAAERARLDDQRR